jgi:hypothetical protein
MLPGETGKELGISSKNRKKLAKMQFQAIPDSTVNYTSVFYPLVAKELGCCTPTPSSVLVMGYLDRGRLEMQNF